jgi:hypothetical protein
MPAIELVTLFWLLVCAVQDFRFQHVSNWLTLPAIPLAVMASVLGWVETPWLVSLIVSGTALFLWSTDLLGGADAKGWLVFALLGAWMMVAAAVGMIIWFLITKATGMVREGRIPGYPGYALGVGYMLLVTKIPHLVSSFSVDRSRLMFHPFHPIFF